MSRSSDSRISSRRQWENCARPPIDAPHPHRATLNKYAVPLEFPVQYPLAARPNLSENAFSRPDRILANYRLLQDLPGTPLYRSITMTTDCPSTLTVPFDGCSPGSS